MQVTRRALLPIFGAVAAVTLLGIIVVYVAGLRVNRANLALLQHEQMHDTLEDTLSTLRDAETAQRGFLLTGQEEHLELHRAALARIESDLQDVERWGQTGAMPADRAEAIIRVSRAKLERMDRNIQLRRQEGMDAAVAAVRSGAGKHLMDELRQQIGQIEAQQNAKTLALRQQRDRATQLRTISASLMALVTVLFVGWAYWRTRRLFAAQSQAEQTNARLAAIVESSDDAIIAKSLEGIIQSWNAGAERLFGYRAEEAIGRPITLLLPPDRQDEERQILQRLRSGEQVEHYETLRVAKDGRRIDVSVTISPVKDREGRIIGASKIARDITERKRTEETLQESEQRLRAFLDNSAVIAWLKDEDGRYAFMSQNYERRLNMHPEQWKGKTDFELWPREAAEKFHRDDQAVLASGGNLEVVEYSRARDGRETWWLTHKFVYRDSSGQRYTGGLAVDVTERQQAEEALRASERLYRAIGESIDYGIWVCDRRGHNIYVSESFLNLLGKTQEECATFGWTDALHPDEAEATLAAWKACVEHGEAWYREHRYRGADGRWHPVLSCGLPVRNEQGAITAWAGINLDISRLKRAEEELAAAKVAAERANAAKDHFLAVLSHELRTPLTPVLPALEAMAGCVPEAAREDIEMARRNVELEARLIDDLLDVTRISRGKIELHREVTDLETILRRAAEVCAPDIEARRLHFGITVAGGPYPVEADPARLQQVFWNLLKNAIKFTPHGGCVGVYCVDDGAGQALVEVHDSGMGIEPEAFSRLFNAFEQVDRSVTRQFGGLGLGLAICKALVEMHGGTIGAHSEGKGKGATFTVRLPVVIGHPSLVLGQQPSEGSTRRLTSDHGPVMPLRILLVEDHGDTARIMRRMLQARGHSVETAGDVATALELGQEKPFDLLLSDLGLPDGSGVELMQQLREHGRVLPGIALSGYGQEEDVRRSHEAGFREHLTKPVNMGQLEAAIGRVAGR